MKHTACRRAIALALILVMLAGILPVTASAAGNPRFDDVKPADWFYSSVETVCGKGLMTGTSARTFRPALPVTRGMLVTILYRLENYPKTASGSPFADVAAGSYYEKAIRWAAANKIVTGYDAAHFGPDDALTREQLAAILYRYADAMGYDVSSGLSHTLYADAAEVSGYAQTAVDWAIAEGFLKGKDGWKLCPKAVATRAELAVILTRFCAYAEPQAAARLKTLLTAAALRPDRRPDDAEEPETGLSIRFDRAETVTTQPSVTLTGSYVSDADVASITYMLTGEYSDFLDKTGDVTYADGRWEIADLRIVPDSSSITLLITDADGNTAAATGSVYYDLGELVDPELVEVAQDEETGLIFASNILLVYFADEASDADKADVARSVGGTVVGQDNFMNMQQLMVEPVTLEEAIQIAEEVEAGFPETVVMAMFDVAFSDDSMVFDDPWSAYTNWNYAEGDEYDIRTGWIYPKGWDDNNPGGSNWNFEAIEASSAWELYGSEFKLVGVGVVDGGFNRRHEDLQGRIIFTDNDAVKRNDDFLSLDTLDANHGTHIAGIIAAIAHNGKGISGIANNAKIIASPGKMTNLTFASAMERGLTETVTAGARVVNFSCGLTGTMNIKSLVQNRVTDIWTEPNLLMAIYSAKMACFTMSKLLASGYDFVVVQSSGNGTNENYACDAIYNGGFATICQSFHELYESVSLEQVQDRIMVVGSVRLNRDGSYTQVNSSNAGGVVCICAPGQQILSCTYGTSGYGMSGGTSMAAPHVAAVAALTWSANEYLTGAQVKQILCSNYNRIAQDNTSEYSKYTKGTFPLVNARLSVKKALEMKYGTTKNYRATIVEGPTAKGMTATSVSAYPSDHRDGYVEISLTWGSNPGVYQTLIALTREGSSFTKSEIDDAIATYPKLWKEELGERPETMPLEQVAINAFSWSFAWAGDKNLPAYVLLLNMDREYNVLGYTIVKVEQV